MPTSPIVARQIQMLFRLTALLSNIAGSMEERVQPPKHGLQQDDEVFTALLWWGSRVSHTCGCESGSADPV
jgi:hypothetical protein